MFFKIKSMKKSFIKECANEDGLTKDDCKADAEKQFPNLEESTDKDIIYKCGTQIIVSKSELNTKGSDYAGILQELIKKDSNIDKSKYTTEANLTSIAGGTKKEITLKFKTSNSETL